jgi:hypothetical protein
MTRNGRAITHPSPWNVQLRTPLQPIPESDSVTVSVFSVTTVLPLSAAALLSEAAAGAGTVSWRVTVDLVVVEPQPDRLALVNERARVRERK